MYLEKLREVSHLKLRVEDRPGIGHSVVFTDEIFDADGNLVSTAEGISVVYSDFEDGSLRQLITGVEKLKDGTISWTGPMIHEDPVGRTEFMTHSLPAIGISGRYAGKTGTRTIKVIERQDAQTTIAEASIYMED
jgi:hypothetical protein